MVAGVQFAASCHRLSLGSRFQVALPALLVRGIRKARRQEKLRRRNREVFMGPSSNASGAEK
jgi:hypothetical protein